MAYNTCVFWKEGHLKIPTHWWFFSPSENIPPPLQNTYSSYHTDTESIHIQRVIKKQSGGPSRVDIPIHITCVWSLAKKPLRENFGLTKFRKVGQVSFHGLCLSGTHPMSMSPGMLLLLIPQWVHRHTQSKSSAIPIVGRLFDYRIFHVRIQEIEGAI